MGKSYTTSEFTLCVLVVNAFPSNLCTIFAQNSFTVPMIQYRRMEIQKGLFF